MGKSIGIDLGTTNSVVAYFDGKTSRVLRTRDETLTPSVVSYKEPSKRRDGRVSSGSILVGRAALNNALVAPEDTIFSIKRLMGRTVDEEKVKEGKRQFSYNLDDVGNSQDRGVRVLLHGKPYTPIELSAMILAQLKQDAEKALGDEVTHAVITVPAYFEERQRAATREAGQQAGLIVKRIIDEPTAAAIAFGFDKPEERHRVLVYDMGGGTFDVSLVQVVNQKFAGLAIEGDMWLGGDDFDYEIVKAIQKWILEKNKSVDLTGDRRFRARAKQKAEEAKILLSGQQEVQLSYPGIVMSPAIDLDMEITQEEFNSWIQPYVDRSMDLVRTALTAQNLGVDDITTVLMVGGATATPLVYEAVTRLFGREKVRRDVDPMHCVAIGASIIAARLDSVECPNCKEVNPEDTTTCRHCGAQIAISRVNYTQVTARSLGISVIKDGKPDSYAVIIPKGTVYPLRKAMERTFYTTAKNTIRVPIYEGEEVVASLNERQGDIEYTLPENIDIGTPVIVSFDYDKDRLLKVTILVQGYPHLKKEVIVDRTGPLGRETKSKKERDWHEELDATINMSQHFLEEYKDFIDPGQASKMESDLRKAREAAASENEAEVGRVMKALDSVILSGSGTASLLFLAANIIPRIPQPKLANELRASVKELRQAVSNKDQEKVAKVSTALRITLRMAAARMDRQEATAIEDRVDYGILQL